MGGALPDIDEIPNADLLKFEKEFLGFYITSHPLTEHQSAIERYTTASTREAMTCAEGVEVMIGGMISRVKKVITKNGRSAGMPMAIITLEDLDGQIDGTMFAETYAEICQKYPDAVAAESIVFVRGKVDRKRETPSLLINEVIPISDALPRLTTSIGLKLDRVRHSNDVVGELRSVLKKHAGKKELFVQLQAGDGRKVSMKINGELGVRITKDLVDDLERLAGNGSVQLGGEGMRRQKRLQQQALFKEEAAAPEVDPAMAPSDEVMEEV
jgi:DNA polymerase-3 subunit alpha